MIDYTKLQSLGALIQRLEPHGRQATVTVLAAEGRDEISRWLVQGLKEHDPDMQVTVQSSAGEYVSHIAVVEIGSHSYTIARDFKDVFISAIQQYACRITPNADGVLVYHLDYPGVVRDVTGILADYKINISKLNVSREQRGQNALLVSLTDEEIPLEVVEKIGQLPRVTRVISLK